MPRSRLNLPWSRRRFRRGGRMCITWLASPWAATRSQPIIRPYPPHDPDSEVSFPPDRPTHRGGGRGAGRDRPAESEP
ncbi:hypothetical protein BDIM_18170 [Brevundimonas diminuta ATCC 11568]|nr:hypothetical protein BDIM_18170 [Brevundimonas diminuta ATCC 11568]